MMTLLVNWAHVWTVTLMGFASVFVLLCVLIAVMKLFGVAMRPKVKVKQANEVHETVAHTEAGKQEATLTGNATAAIAMALHLYYNGVHDEEPTKVTTKRVHTQWNNKMYGMNNLHR